MLNRAISSILSYLFDNTISNISFEYANKAGFKLFSSCMCNIEFETAHAQFADSFPNRGRYSSNIISTNYICMKFIFRNIFPSVRFLSLSLSLSLSLFLSLCYTYTFIFYAKMYIIKTYKAQISLIKFFYLMHKEYITRLKINLKIPLNFEKYC